MSLVAKTYSQGDLYMNKKLIALAIAAAIAPAAAMADSGNVSISGNLHMSVDSLNGKNAAGDNLDRNTNISSNSSNIVFSGDEDLGNGLKAVWKLSTYVGMGATGNGDNSWTNGNSYIGLNGGFGTALVGKHDTPMKLTSRKYDLFGDQIGDNRNMTSQADGGAGWDLRPDNVIAYISPTMSGVHGAIAYVSNTAAGAATDKTVDAWSGLVMYDQGPVSVTAAYERHNLGNANDAANDESAWRLGAGYTAGDIKVVGLYQKTKDVGGSSDGRKTWGLGGAYKMAANTIKLQYYRAADLDNHDDSGANMWALGADHAMSKRTTAYVAYARTSNDANASYSAFGGGHGDNPGTVAGKNPSGFSLGMKHSF
jgi:predicted porin